MIHKRIPVQFGYEASLLYPYAEVDIFSIHIFESADLFINLPRKSHVERTRFEFLHMGFSAPYATGGPKRSHGIADCFLSCRERGMFPVRSTETVGIIVVKIFPNRLEVIGRDDAVRVEEDQVTSLGMFHPYVTGIASSGIFFDDVMNIEFRAKSFDFGRTWKRRTVFDQDEFEVVIRL